MRIEVLHPRQLDAQQLAEWRSMQRESLSLASPFLSPEFTLAVGRRSDRAHVAVLHDGDERVGYFPFERSRFGIGRPIGAGVSDYQGVVHRPGAKWDPIHLLRACGLAVLEFDHLAEGQTPFAPYVRRYEASPVSDLSGGYAVYVERLREQSKSVRSLLKQERRLRRDFGDVRFDWSSGSEETLRVLLDWKSAQYRRTGRVDRFAKRWIAELVRELMHTDTASFAGVLSALWVGPEPVALHLGLRSDRVLAFWFPAYNPKFEKYSPGMILRLRMAEAAAERQIERVDFGKGQFEHKERLKTGDLRVAEAQMRVRTPLAVAYQAHREPLRRAERFVLDRPKLRVAARKTLVGVGRVRSRSAV
jgi:CelD/BcsL family acetyltransferase involved in cellulose biosynthesis